jgi:hypothetical protein
MIGTRNKYYTAFVFKSRRGKGADLERGHVTHKYLGEMGEEKKQMAWMVITDFFHEPHLFPRAHFDCTDWFGSNRVLRPAHVTLGDWFIPLRDLLGQFREDDYPEYKPHIATKTFKCDEAFIGYALVNSTEAKINYLWRNPQYA